MIGLLIRAAVPRCARGNRCRASDTTLRVTVVDPSGAVIVGARVSSDAVG
jgi:hypothetical protein